jgi:prepilin peptidase CpaA
LAPELLQPGPIAVTEFLPVIFLVLIMVSVVTDLREMIIPNWISAAVPLLFIPAAWLAGMDWAVIGGHAVAFLAAFAVCFALFYLNVFGGGDAKLIPGVVLWLGPAAVTPFLFAMALVGGLLGIILIIARNTLPAGNIVIMQKSSGVPYAVAIAAGVVFAAPHAALLSPLLEQVRQFVPLD